jgi:type IV pilus assembly protein PilF
MQARKRTQLIAAALICMLSASCGLLPDFSKSGMSNSEKANLNLQMGARYLELNMLQVAKEKLETAYDLDSNNPEILNALAVFYERVKEDERAEELYQSALRREPDNYSTQNNYGHFLCEHGNFEKGMEMLQAALDSVMNQHTWLALTNMGLCWARQNENDKAEEYFRRALFGNPEYAPALQEMLKISYHKQEYMSARAFMERYQAVAQHTPETLWLGYQTERAMGNMQAAEKLKDQLLSTFPTSTEAIQVKSVNGK